MRNRLLKSFSRWRIALSTLAIGLCIAGPVVAPTGLCQSVHSNGEFQETARVAAESLPAPGDAAMPPPLPLTNAAQIRALSREEAARQPSVRLKGVVLMSESWGMVIADETAEIYLAGVEKQFQNFRFGDLVSLEGVAYSGEFAPVAAPRRIWKLGRGAIPRPQAVAFDELLSGRFDGQWVEVSGVLRRSGSWMVSDDPVNWQLWLATGGGRLAVRLTREQGEPLVVDSELRVRGLCFHQFDRAGHAVSPLLFAASQDPVVVIRQAPADPYAVPIRPVDSLLQFSLEDLFKHRVRVCGVVTYADSSSSFWLQDGDHGLHVSTQYDENLVVGEKVDVVGFLSRGNYAPALEDAVLHRQGMVAPPKPVRLTGVEQVLEHDADLVEIEATIEAQWLALDGCRLVLVKDGTRFPALLRLTSQQKPPRGWLAGSRVRLAGICSVTPDPRYATSFGVAETGSFQLLLRSASDLQVLAPPPWWTAERVGWRVAGILGVLLVLGTALAWSHRRRTARQVAMMKAQAALADERSRIARDLHDEIGANLTHISILSTLATQPDTQPSVSSQHSTEAANVARQTIRAFDEILWSINPKNDTLQSLSHYICRYAEETLAPAGLKHRFELDENFPELHLPPQSRHSLLLAVKESLHNILKHAAARRVNIKCGMENERVFLVQVTDDGRGFDPGAVSAVPTRRQGQGLENLRRRLTEMGGDCQIESQPGHGTRVTFRLPL